MRNPKYVPKCFFETSVTEKKFVQPNSGIYGRASGSTMTNAFLLAWTSNLTTHTLLVGRANVIRQGKKIKSAQRGKGKILQKAWSHVYETRP